MELYLTKKRAKLLIKVLIYYFGLLNKEEKELTLTLIAELGVYNTKEDCWS